MKCSHCGEPINPTDGFAEFHGDKSHPVLCLDCADLFDAQLFEGVEDFCTDYPSDDNNNR